MNKKILLVLALIVPRLVLGDGSVSVDMNHNSHRIYGISLLPTVDSEATSKKYVDDLIASVTLQLGNLTDVGTDGITVTGGTGAVVGSGTTLSQHVADASHNGYLSSTDWNTFNDKQDTIIFGDLSDAGTDGITITGGIGAVNGSGTSLSQHVADSAHNGYLSSTDWINFNAAVTASGVSSWNGRTGAVVPVTGDYSDSQISFTDITTNDSSTSQHGFFPKLSGDPTLFFNGQGQQVVIPNQGTVGSHLISGGGVAWTGSGLNFIVSAADYIINGNEYLSAQTPLTLTAADPTLDRIDTFYVDDSGVANYITGTPAANPVAPSVDPATQLALTFVYIQAGATIPNVTTENIYLENTEWTMSASGGSINVASTNNPYAGTKDVEGTSVASGTFFTGVKPSGSLKPADYTSLIFQIRSKAAWPNAKAISVFWMNGASAVGSSATLKQGAYGFDSSNTTTYQQIVVPTSIFNTGTSSVDRLRFQVTGGGGNIGWYIDNVILQAASGGTTSGGDFSTNTTTSVANEVVLFADTTGKLGKRSTITGLGKFTAGVLSAATAGVDYQTPITPAALTKTDDTNVTLTLGGTPATALLQATSITAGWTGTLAMSRGGLGIALTDPNANKFLGWDDTDNAYAFWALGTGLTYDHSTHTINASTSQVVVSNFTFGLKRSSGVTTGKLPAYWTCPFNGTITAWNMTVDTGTITVKIWKKATGTAHPTSSDSINTSGIALSSNTNIRSTTLTDFTTTTVTAGDVFAAEVTAVSGVTDFGGSIEITRN